MSRFFAATRYLIIIPLPIAALGIFLGLRAWAARQEGNVIQCTDRKAAIQLRLKIMVPQGNACGNTRCTKGYILEAIYEQFVKKKTKKNSLDEDIVFGPVS